jgi:hypothetical protein
MVNYAFEGEWSPSSQAGDAMGMPKGIAVANDRVYVVFRAQSGPLYSVYGSSIPGVQQQPEPMVAASRHPSVVRGVLVLGPVGSRQKTGYRAELMDAMGRKVMELRPGANDVRALAPGVYFVREAQAQAQAQAQSVRRVVITK